MKLAVGAAASSSLPEYVIVNWCTKICSDHSKIFDDANHAFISTSPAVSTRTRREMLLREMETDRMVGVVKDFGMI